MPAHSNSSAVAFGPSPLVSGRPPNSFQSGRIISRAALNSPLSFSSRARSHRSNAFALAGRCEVSSFARVVLIGLSLSRGREKSYDCEKDISLSLGDLQDLVHYCSIPV